MNLNLRFESSEIERFGVRIARLTVESSDSSVAAADILALCYEQEVEMLTLRVPTSRTRLVQDLESAGFRLMDCLVYFEARPSGQVRPLPPDLQIRHAEAGDADGISRVALACFEDYPSHYRADSRLDRAQIANGYVDWARRSCEAAGSDEAVLVCLEGHEVAGFATLRRNTASETEGLLFAVHPVFAGRGAHGALIERAMAWTAQGGQARMIISTQLENYRVQRSYVNRGFRLFGSYYTFHRWFV